MIVRLKCVDNIDWAGEVSGYLTNGKVYVAVVSKRNKVALIDDEGDLIRDDLDDHIHAEWEIV